MLGANYDGQPYYGQGAAISEDAALKNVAASVSMLATLTATVGVNKFVEASIVMLGTQQRTLLRLVTASMSMLGTITKAVRFALNLKQGSTLQVHPRRFTRRIFPDDE